ncbi:hypothetical protein Dpep_1248 [Dethiosulfovibrio peptidovorans DSM 11002]|uniref:Uncharacterized protein n=1 Tax=Dethiosulfovibrio peptidovorans DSM 11002 TaxID=469381 RepID=D2Z727_9BACT|nr:hypothetical protein Dpep_1248 [Dethiosulfovibrio peptidovorans DSM 11002]
MRVDRFTTEVYHKLNFKNDIRINYTKEERTMWNKDDCGNWYPLMSSVTEIESTSSLWDKDSEGNWYLRRVVQESAVSVH